VRLKDEQAPPPGGGGARHVVLSRLGGRVSPAVADHTGAGLLRGARAHPRVPLPAAAQVHPGAGRPGGAVGGAVQGQLQGGLAGAGRQRVRGRPGLHLAAERRGGGVGGGEGQLLLRVQLVRRGQGLRPIQAGGVAGDQGARLRHRGLRLRGYAHDMPLRAAGQPRRAEALLISSRLPPCMLPHTRRSSYSYS
jgi:hypothetical protein